MFGKLLKQIAHPSIVSIREETRDPILRLHFKRVKRYWIRFQDTGDDAYHSSAYRTCSSHRLTMDCKYTRGWMTFGTRVSRQTCFCCWAGSRMEQAVYPSCLFDLVRVFLWKSVAGYWRKASSNRRISRTRSRQGKLAEGAGCSGFFFATQSSLSSCGRSSSLSGDFMGSSWDNCGYLPCGRFSVLPTAFRPSSSFVAAIVDNCVATGAVVVAAADVFLLLLCCWYHLKVPSRGSSSRAFNNEQLIPRSQRGRQTNKPERANSDEGLTISQELMRPTIHSRVHNLERTSKEHPQRTPF